jgi:outer membrane receptor protein involved in Fe transport
MFGRRQRFHIAPAVLLLAAASLFLAVSLRAQEPAAGQGGIRGVIYDADYNLPVPAVRVTVAETGQAVLSGEDGHFRIPDLPPGGYTVVFASEGFQRETRAGVIVLEGRLTELEVRVFGAYTDLEEVIVEDIELGGATEVGLLLLRQQSVGMVDSVGADLMSRAGAGTAIAAMRLVTGTSVQDGKYVVIRGLGDRYTSTLLNGVRLPTADKDKRAVQLDQFPAAMIESIQVNKTFTPDQQGDASGGGVNIITKSVPDSRVLSASLSMEYDMEATGNRNFKVPLGGGNGFGGMRSRKNALFWNPGDMTDPRGLKDLERSPTLTESAPPPNYGAKVAVGDSVKIGDWQLGALMNGSYSQKYKFREGEKTKISNDSLVSDVKVMPQYFKTTEMSIDEQLWSAALTLGAKNDNNEIKAMGMYTHLARESATLRYQPLTAPISFTYDPNGDGVLVRDTIRTRFFDTLSQYSESGNGSLQLVGKHKLDDLHGLELDWTGAYSVSESTEPDRQSFNAGSPDNGWGYTFFQERYVATGELVPGSQNNQSLIQGLLARQWQDVREGSRQFQANAKQPFEVFGYDGYLKAGIFDDTVQRKYRNRIYQAIAPFDAADEYDFSRFDSILGALSFGGATPISTEYNAFQDVTAYYGMARAPLPEWLDVIGGLRLESTEIRTEVWSMSPGMEPGKIFFAGVIDKGFGDGPELVLNEVQDASQGAANISQVDPLPSLSLNLKPIADVSLRLAWSKTIARPTFKELSPVMYPEDDPSRYFVGNQNLKISSVENYDARLEWRPGGRSDLVAVSAFYKTIIDPIQYTAYASPFPGSDEIYMFPENYGDATIRGVEFEGRKGLGFLWSGLEDLSVGANATLQDSLVKYTEATKSRLRAAGVTDTGRPMDGQPAFLVNLNLVFDHEPSGVSAAIFYNFKGETFVAGEGATTKTYLPHIVEMPVASLDASLGFKFARIWRLGFEAKNILDPVIESVFRKPTGDLPNTSYRQGRTFSASLGCSF